MMIRRMTATFGKLEHTTLELQEGLCVIEAPNEWGKSTWCAFLCAMFYGIETRSHSTKNTLADKEHYLPWSGSPMSGRIDLIHRGQNITIERSSRGRIPFGTFRAYETESGLPIPELTAENCGELLLGAEKEVFLRSAFLRLTDMAVTQSDSLRRRLNALVTTGDESGAADALSARLTKLKNTIRANSRSGLLPQLEDERQALQSKLADIHTLSRRIEDLECQLEEAKRHQSALLNHRQALAYRKSLEAQARLEEARHEEESVRARLAGLETECAALPSREELERIRRKAELLRSRQADIHLDSAMEGTLPEEPTPLFGRSDPDALDRQIRLDRKARTDCLAALSKKQFPLWIIGLCLLIAGAAGLLLSVWVGCAVMASGLSLLIIGLVRKKRFSAWQLKHRLVLSDLKQCYGSDDPDLWQQQADDHRRRTEEYRQRLSDFRSGHARRTALLEEITAQLQELTGGMDLNTFLTQTDRAIRLWDRLEQTRRELQRAAGHSRSLETAAPVQPPQFPDELTFTEAETDRLISDSTQRVLRLQTDLSGTKGRMDAMGDAVALLDQLKTLTLRIHRLQAHLEAIEYARETLTEAKSDLQRRFAPRLTRRAGELFSRLTAGRYDRLTMDRELTVLAAAEGEDILRSVLWRSDGTADQLYLALRLALWEELTPEAPLVLDDALVRFDDIRLKQALEVLKELGSKKQILLFTCQKREQSLLQ